MGVICWSAALGDCCDVQSEEHLVSENFFEGDMVSVQGFSWCRDAPKTIPVRKAASNILCKSHNTALSEIDAESGKATRAIRELRELHALREKFRTRSWEVKRYELSGQRLERWFLKTLINFMCMPGNERWADNGAEGVQPPAEIVRAVHSRQAVPMPMGLYIAAHIGQTTTPVNRLRTTVLNSREGLVQGGLFECRGFRFLIWASSAPVPETLPSTVSSGWAGAGLMAHPNAIQFPNKGYRSQELIFRWADAGSSEVPHRRSSS